MKVFNKDACIFFDVDNTLVMHKGTDQEFCENGIFIYNPYSEHSHFVIPNEDNILLLRRSSGRKRGVIVWSHGGPKWAAAVIKALNLEKYVDLVIVKPELYVDDVPIEQWQFINLYLKHGYGVTVTK